AAVELPRQVPVCGVAALAFQEPVVLAPAGEPAQDQTSRAVSTTSSSLRHCSSCDSALPWCVLEKPHCGERHRSSRGTNLEAWSIRRFSSSLLSTIPVFEETRPRTTFFPFGR